jgi:hypothetical protein
MPIRPGRSCVTERSREPRDPTCAHGTRNPLALAAMHLRREACTHTVRAAVVSVDDTSRAREGRAAFAVGGSTHATHELARLYEGGPITVPLTQEALAEMAGTSRATVNRVLREEQKRGSVELARGRTVVRDLEEVIRRPVSETCPQLGRGATLTRR